MIIGGENACFPPHSTVAAAPPRWVWRRSATVEVGRFVADDVPDRGGIAWPRGRAETTLGPQRESLLRHKKMHHMHGISIATRVATEWNCRDGCSRCTTDEMDWHEGLDLENSGLSVDTLSGIGQEMRGWAGTGAQGPGEGGSLRSLRPGTDVTGRFGVVPQCPHDRTDEPESQPLL